MQLHLLVAGTDKMIDDVRRRSVATRAAKPLATCQAPYDAAWIVDATVTAHKLAKLMGLQPVKDRPTRMRVVAILYPLRLLDRPCR